MKVRAASERDSAAIASIYAPYVTGSFISFEMEAPGEEEMARRIAAGGALYPWLAAEVEGALSGYACACAFRTRPAYRFTVETSVYVTEGAQGRGVGRALYGALLALLERQGFAQAVAAISLPNDSSVRFHEAFGFTASGIYRQVGYKMGGWRDVGIWQRRLAPPPDPPREPLPLAQIGWRS